MHAELAPMHDPRRHPRSPLFPSAGNLCTPEYADTIEHIVIVPIATTREWKNHFPSVMKIVDMAMAELGGDASRLSLAGQSMGGHGAWLLGFEQAARFSAIVVCCGFIAGKEGGPIPPELVSALAPKPVWVFHAEDDGVIPVANSDQAVEALKAGGSTKIKFTRYPPGTAPDTPIPGGVLKAHASYELAFKDPGFWPWIKEQSL